jgi:hypothetical protein
MSREKLETIEFRKPVVVERKLKLVLAAIGKRVRELRIESGAKTYEGFAFDRDLPRNQYWRVERGRYNITIRTLVAVLHEHTITLKEFVESLDLE